MPCRRGDRSRRFRLHLQRTRLLHAGRPSRSQPAGQPPRCGQLLHGPAHADTRRRAVVPQRCLRLSDIHRKPLLGYVFVPHPARRQASRRGEKSRVWLSRPPYTFFPFSSPIDLQELLCRRSQERPQERSQELRTSGRLKNSPWLAILALCRETRAGSEGALVTNCASNIVLEVSIIVLIEVLIESAAVWRFCWALVGGKRELRPLLLFRRG